MSKPAPAAHAAPYSPLFFQQTQQGFDAWIWRKVANASASHPYLSRVFALLIPVRTFVEDMLYCPLSALERGVYLTKDIWDRTPFPKLFNSSHKINNSIWSTLKHAAYGVTFLCLSVLALPVALGDAAKDSYKLLRDPSRYSRERYYEHYFKSELGMYFGDSIVSTVMNLGKNNPELLKALEGGEYISEAWSVYKSSVDVALAGKEELQDIECTKALIHGAIENALWNYDTRPKS